MLPPPTHPPTLAASSQCCNRLSPPPLPKIHEHLPTHVRTHTGVYAGGIESAGDLVQTGRARPDDFRLLAGYTGWGAAQLRQEVADGAWWVVAASSELIKECLKGACALRCAAREARSMLERAHTHPAAFGFRKATCRPSPSLLAGPAETTTNPAPLPHHREKDDIRQNCYDRILRHAGIRHNAV
jgi:hypothetical protein